SLNRFLRSTRVVWHGTRLNAPDWRDVSHSGALSAGVRKEKLLLHGILKAYWDPLDFELPQAKSSERDPWRRWIGTTLSSPQNQVSWQEPAHGAGYKYRVGPRSVVVLYAGLGEINNGE